jgi:hypothetical protein
VSVLLALDRALFEPVLGALDVARARALRWTAPVTRTFVRDREARVVAAALVSCGFALIATGFATGWLLLLGPLLFGMPHLVAEARYLFFQRHRGDRRLLAVLALQSVCAFAGFGVLALGPCCALALAVVAHERSRFDAALLAIAAVMLAVAIVAPTWSRFALLHGHNLVPLVVWIAWRDRPWAVSAIVAGAVGACIAAILLGAFDGVAVRTPLSDEAFSLTRLTDAVAGEFGGPWRRRFLLLFGFMQAVHYAIWLRLVPEDARERTTPRSWRASWRAYQRDAGPIVARLTVFAIVAVPLFAIALGPVRARSFYVVASEFHATVEILLVALLLRRRQPVVPVDAPVSLEPPSLEPPSLDVLGAGTHKPQSDVMSNSWYSQTVEGSEHATSHAQIGTHTSIQHPSPRSH